MERSYRWSLGWTLANEADWLAKVGRETLISFLGDGISVDLVDPVYRGKSQSRG